MPPIRRGCILCAEIGAVRDAHCNLVPVRVISSLDDHARAPSRMRNSSRAVWFQEYRSLCRMPRALKDALHPDRSSSVQSARRCHRHRTDRSSPLHPRRSREWIEFRGQGGHTGCHGLHQDVWKIFTRRGKEEHRRARIERRELVVRHLPQQTNASFEPSRRMARRTSAA